MNNVLDSDLTFKILDRFYKECLDFWFREINVRGYETDLNVYELAYIDIVSINHNPYSPNGKLLDLETKTNFLNSIK